MNAKKIFTIISEVLLLYVFLIICFRVYALFSTYSLQSNLNAEWGGYEEDLRVTLTWIILCIVAAVADFAAMILILLPLIAPLSEKINSSIAAHRDARAKAHAEKKAADKQRRIEELQSELDDLKKND